ncbi:hypothetical protein DCC39_04725 [Pueribacillus theae]|uniref:Spore coat protein n=1 Tax=Pueribacillus theae TaxID=2171751 RepID=A0A2U1K705_9BACI|nr:hypothetical protein [Pueribacillus theae]PWA12743.1 hypothetical protein DCC39_04725 [Pueribacillus theae]
MEEKNEYKPESQNDNNSLVAQADKMSETVTNTLVKGILRKHGVTKEKLNPLDEEQKEELRKMVRDLQKQVEELRNPKVITEDTPKKSEKTVNTRGRRKGLL